MSVDRAGESVWLACLIIPQTVGKEKKKRMERGEQGGRAG